MSDNTPRLGLPELAQMQEMDSAQINEALVQMDALSDVALKGLFVNTPPASPVDGDTYVTGGAPTGAWSGYLYKLAYCLDGGWRFYNPHDGLLAYLGTSDSFTVYRGGAWKALGALIAGPDASIASAATCDLSAAGALCLQVTGTTAITSFGAAANTLRFVRFAGALTLTHNATSLALLGGVTRTTAANDIGIYRSDGNCNWRELAYCRAAADPGDYATKTGAETFSHKTLSGATAFPGGGSIDASGNILVGNSALLSTASISPAVQVVRSGADAGVLALRYNNSATGTAFRIAKSRATTPGGFTAVAAGDVLGGLTAYGADGTQFVEAAQVSARIAATPGTGTMVAKLDFYTNNGAAASTVRWSIMNDGHVLPAADNGYNIGSASFRAATIYAGTGAINTSDAATKVNMRAMSAAEIAVARALAGGVRLFQFVDAVGKKGDAARLHAGQVAQDVAAAFAAQGLDAARYGVFCEDPALAWDGDGNPVPVRDENGTQKTVQGLRYDELAQFVLAGLFAQCAQMGARLDALAAA